MADVTGIAKSYAEKVWDGRGRVSPGLMAGAGTQEEQQKGHESSYADEPVPMGGHAALVAVFSVAFTGGLALARRRGRGIPERVSPGDIAPLGVATHKLSRLLTKDRVTSFARAPFTHLEERSGHGEVEEHARGEGARRAVRRAARVPLLRGPVGRGRLHGRHGRRSAPDPPRGGDVHVGRDRGRPPAGLHGGRGPGLTPGRAAQAVLRTIR